MTSAACSRPARGPLVPALLCSLLACVAARAQTVDYDGLETLFQEPVTASATGKAQRASDAPADIEIITADQIRRSGADNLPDILRFVPGLDVRRYGFASAEVSVRGYSTFSNPRLLVLINGRQAYLDDFGRTQWYALPVEIDDIRQVEVIKGPNSALYGFNAASGVINIITWNPLLDHKQSATIRGGTQDYAAGSAAATAQFGQWGAVRLSGGGFKARDFEWDSNAGLDNSPRRGAVTADGRFRIAPGVEGALTASHVNLRTAEPVGSPFYASSRYRLDLVQGSLTAETRFGVLSATAYRNDLGYDYDTGAGRTQTGNTVTVAQASDLFKVGASHAIRLGVEFRDNVEHFPRYGSTVGYDVFAGSAMWDWQILPSLSFTNAVRLDHLQLHASGPLVPFGAGRSQADYNRRTITETSWNSGLVWHATERDTVRILAARGLQAPSLTALGHQDVGVVPGTSLPIAFVGAPNLQPTIIHQGEIGYERGIESLASTIRVAGFVQRTDNVIADPFAAMPTVGPRGIVLQSANIGSSAATGGEVSLRGESGRWRWNASYAYISIEDHLDRKAGASWLRFQDGTPAHVVTVGGGYTAGPLEIDVQGRWQSRYRDYAADSVTSQIYAVDVSDYLQLDARVAYNLTRNLTLAITGNQFNVSRLSQSSGRPVERRLLLSATAKF